MWKSLLEAVEHGENSTTFTESPHTTVLSCSLQFAACRTFIDSQATCYDKEWRIDMIMIRIVVC